MTITTIQYLLSAASVACFIVALWAAYSGLKITISHLEQKTSTIRKLGNSVGDPEKLP